MNKGNQILAPVVFAFAAVVAWTCTTCGGESTSNGPESDAGPEGDVESSDASDDGPVGDGGETDWMPMEPLGENGEFFPLVPSGPAIDCGPGCEAVIPKAVNHPDYFSYSFDSRYVSETDVREVFVLDIAKGEVRIVARAADDDDGVIQPHVHGRYVSYHRVRYPSGRVEVVDIVEKRVRVFDAYEDVSYAARGTAVNNHYAFWIPGNLRAADLTTGVKRLLTTEIVGCDRHCTTETSFLCSTTTDVVNVDANTGEVSVIAPTAALQTDGICSPNKERFVWIDYRDPPGPSSTYDGYRAGGEVYVFDLQSNELTRVTHDSPTAPTAKSYPAIENDTVVWLEARSSEPQPDTAQEIYLWKPALVWYDLQTKKRCKTDDINITRPAVIDGKVYGMYVHEGDGNVWLVRVDLNSSNIPWSCTQS